MNADKPGHNRLPEEKLKSVWELACDNVINPELVETSEQDLKMLWEAIGKGLSADASAEDYYERLKRIDQN